MKTIFDLSTPCLLIDADALDANLAVMSERLPGSRLRPHVKAHKCTSLARRQAKLGHRGFTCATVREVEGMARAGLGEDLLLANEVLDAGRLGAVDARVTLAVDSVETVDAAARGGIREVLIDVNVGLPRCGCAPSEAGRLADRARAAGMRVRGVMGYEGHAVGIPDRSERERLCGESMQRLLEAHADTGGDVISAGGTGTYDCNTWATEIQAGSYALMDSAYQKLEHPFVQALWLWLSVISLAPEYAVADGGLKCLAMDHGNPTSDAGRIWFCSDEHITFAPGVPVAIGDRIRVVPAHVDPTMAYHERVHIVSGETVLDEWEIDLRGW